MHIYTSSAFNSTHAETAQFSNALSCSLKGRAGCSRRQPHALAGATLHVRFRSNSTQFGAHLDGLRPTWASPVEVKDAKLLELLKTLVDFIAPGSCPTRMRQMAIFGL